MPQHCLNCDHALQSDALHCKQCGQKVRIQQLSLWSIVQDFFANLLNLETKIWRTFRDIWIPAKLTKAFISGKRVTYYNPIRIFIITLFTFFTLFLFNIKSSFGDIEKAITAKQHEVWRIEMSERFDSLRVMHNWSEALSDTIKEELFRESFVVAGVLEDSLQSDSTYRQELSSNDGLSHNTNISYNSRDSLVNFNLGNGKITDGIMLNDLFRISEQELRDTYKGKPWLNTIAIIQIHKILANFSSSIQFLIGNGTWVIIAVILLLSGFFKLLYWRHNYLYAEHFIFHVYGHTRLLILAIIGLILEIFLLDTNVWLIPWFIIGLIYLYLGMLRFYRQSKLKTILKLVITFNVYSFLLGLCFMLVFGLSFLFF